MNPTITESGSSVDPTITESGSAQAASVMTKIKESTPDVVVPDSKCYICPRAKYSAVLQCRRDDCKKKVCNLHFCDVCRHCLRHCVCWERLSAVYHPPTDEAPAR